VRLRTTKAKDAIWLMRQNWPSCTSCQRWLSAPRNTEVARPVPAPSGVNVYAGGVGCTGPGRRRNTADTRPLAYLAAGACFLSQTGR